jgi:cytochrome c553
MNKTRRMPAALRLVSTAAAVTCALAAAVSFASMAAAGAEPLPAWVFPSFKPPPQPSRDDGTLRSVPNSTVSYTLDQVRDRFLAPDWHPHERPAMPDVVARGRKPDVFACGFCHRADGIGGPENANLTGLPASYIVQQMKDFRSGARKSSAHDQMHQQFMMKIAASATDEEMEAAAAYFASVKPRSTVRVVETETVPKTFVTSWHFAVKPGGETEPLGRRLLEVPEDLQHFVSRDTNARFIAYVPPGSIGKGQTLATGVPGKTIACSTCHGPDLKGLGPVPGIAGRSPSYMVRQLYDMKHGTRAGVGSGLMKAVVENLTLDDMVELAAYAGSIAP